MELSKRERREIYFRQRWRFPTDIPFCINCEYFFQHYVKGGPPVFTVNMAPLDCGHCAFPRVKDRKAYDTCGHFHSRYVNDK